MVEVLRNFAICHWQCNFDQQKDLSHMFYLYINYIICKFIIIRYGETFSLNVLFFSTSPSYLTSSLTLGTLFKTALKTAGVATLVILGILSSISLILAL